MNRSSSSTSVECRQITVSFAGRTIIEGLNLTLPAGSTTSLVGPSGSGKSTILRCINGWIEPDQGQILINGSPLDRKHIEKERRRMGIAVQGTGLFPHMNVERNIALLAHLEKWPRKKIERRIDELMSLVSLNLDYKKRYPHELSGGEQQRVGLCRAMMLEPKILLLDEAFSALDPVTRSEIHQEFLRLREHEDVTILLVTHDMTEALKLGNQIVILKDGKIIRSGTPVEIQTDPGSDFARSLFSSGAMD